jgi:hypothetical protein
MGLPNSPDCDSQSGGYSGSCPAVTVAAQMQVEWHQPPIPTQRLAEQSSAKSRVLLLSMPFLKPFQLKPSILMSMNSKTAGQFVGKKQEAVHTWPIHCFIHEYSFVLRIGSYATMLQMCVFVS